MYLRYKSTQEKAIGLWALCRFYRQMFQLLKFRAIQEARPHLIKQTVLVKGCTRIWDVIVVFIWQLSDA